MQRGNANIEITGDCSVVEIPQGRDGAHIMAHNTIIKLLKLQKCNFVKP